MGTLSEKRNCLVTFFKEASNLYTQINWNIKSILFQQKNLINQEFNFRYVVGKFILDFAKKEAFSVEYLSQNFIKFEPFWIDPVKFLTKCIC